jgi:hypothetical protein
MSLYIKNQQTMISVVYEAALAEPDAFRGGFIRKLQGLVCGESKAHMIVTGSLPGVFHVLRPPHLDLDVEISSMPTGRPELENQLGEERESWMQMERESWIRFVTHDEEFLKKEWLKSQHMAERRASIADSIDRNAWLQEEADKVTKATHTLCSMIEAHAREHQCLFEKRSGIVTEKLGDEIEVTFDLPDGPLKQIYRLSQFKGDRLPSEGDMVEARLSLVIVDQPERSDSDFDSPLPSFEDIESPKEVQI